MNALVLLLVLVVFAFNQGIHNNVHSDCLLLFFLSQGASLKPSRVGQLSPSSSIDLAPTGLVFLLNTTAVYIKSFQSRSGKNVQLM